MENELTIIKQRILNQNLRWFKYVPFALVPLNILHVIIFYTNLPESDIIEYEWRMGVIQSHTAMAFVSVMVGFFGYFQEKKKLFDYKTSSFICWALTMIFLLINVGLSVVDQPVNTGILPYIISSLAISVVLVMPPWHSISIFIIAVVFFQALLPFNQPDMSKLLSISANSGSLTIVSIFLSIRLWRITKARHQQLIVIDKQNEKLKETNIQLEKLNATKDKFFSIIAHDLRSPFNNILSLTELIKEDIGDKNYESLDEYAQMLSSSSQRSMDLLTNLMTWALAQNGKIDFHGERLNMREIVLAEMQLLKHNAIQKGILLDCQIENDFFVFGDRNMLSLVVRNLISNALKFTTKGGKVWISVEKEGEKTIVISVADSGIGMPKNMIEKLFELGATTGRSGTSGEPSTGLGLILVQEFVSRHNGKIEVESSQGKGSIFKVFLLEMD
ncbi:MAG: HAMP domain-containing histidine kinase [Bacteroidales bacterium]|nr:HAMP domain-containing histidine kinase [Bacteroidales bacterium]